MLALFTSGAASAGARRLNELGGAAASSWPRGVTPENVVTTYGKRGGVRVMAGGYDVCSLAYTHHVLKKGSFHAQIRPKYQDLSDAKGWPDIFVEPGWLALDPASKRIKFSQGNDIDGFRWVTRLDLGGFAPVGTVIDGDIAYVCSTEDGSGVLFLDISDPKAMKVAGNCPIPGFPSSAVKNGDLLYVYGSYQLTVVDVSDLARPRVVNGIHDRWTIGDRKTLLTMIGGKYLAIAHQSFVTLLRVYSDGNVDPVAVWDVPGGYNSCVLRGNQLILGGSKGVHVLDVAAPLKPGFIQMSHERPISGIRAVGDRFVGYDEEGLILFSVSAVGEVSG